MKKLLFVTTASLATNPRLVKELHTCVLLGHRATVFCFSFQNWSKAINDSLLSEFEGRVQFVLLPGDRAHKIAWLSSSFVNLLARWFTKCRYRNIYLSSISISKRSWLLLAALSRHRFSYDVVIAHNPGAFAPALFYSTKWKIKLGIDIEDYHPGENNDPVSTALLEAIMKNALTKADVVTAASPLILEQSERFFLHSRSSRAVIRNVFSVDMQPPYNALADRPLRMIWFSQTVGLNRGLQDAISAMCQLSDYPICLTVVGSCTDEKKTILSGLMSEKKHTLTFLPPMQERLLVKECSRHHIGLALEPGFSLNNSLALSNKIFTYLLAGNAVVASKTEAQKKFMGEHEGIGDLYEVGNSEQFAKILREYVETPDGLCRRRRHSYELARTKLNWDVESQTFIQLYNLQ